jgi:predicted aconitase with swiveling domain
MIVQADILVPGSGGSGEALIFSQPISFWGGIDPASGRVTDVRHPQHGASIAGRVIFLPGTIGSSSASAVLLELVHAGHAPAAIVMDSPDAILLLGLLVAREMGWPTPIAVQLPASNQPVYAGQRVAVGADGVITIL